MTWYSLILINRPMADFDLIPVMAKSKRGLLIKINKIHKIYGIKKLTMKEFDEQLFYKPPDWSNFPFHPNCRCVDIPIKEVK